MSGLNKKGEKTKICFVNPLQDFSNHKCNNKLPSTVIKWKSGKWENLRQGHINILNINNSIY